MKGSKVELEKSQRLFICYRKNLLDHLLSFMRDRPPVEAPIIILKISQRRSSHRVDRLFGYADGTKGEQRQPCRKIVHILVHLLPRTLLSDLLNIDS